MVEATVTGEALRDEATPVRITGLPAGASVALVAEVDRTGASSRTVFEASADGVVDTGTDEPTEGYDGVRPMGWLWSMDGGLGRGGEDGVEIDLRVVRDGEVVAGTTTKRRWTASGVDSRRVDDPVSGTLYVPEETPAPGVVLFHGSGGRPMHRTALLLAARGYAALAVEYFGAEGLPDELREIPLSSLERTGSWLRDQPAVAGDSIGLLGASKGAEAALQVAGSAPWVGALVGIAPSTYRWQALADDAETSSWSRDGDPLPYVPFRAAPGTDDDGDTVFRATYAGSLDRVDDDRLDAAAIDLDAIDAPALLVAGEADAMWPSAEFLAGVSAPNVTTETYPDAGHGITVPYVPTAPTTAAGGMALGGTVAGNAAANADWWPRALSLLEREL